ncbi:MAG: hypothetical protein K9J13_16300 [Saprospiraceae bacterium]|nr:hypothetical protein [Saprospiraceae bacterium]
MKSYLTILFLLTLSFIYGQEQNKDIRIFTNLPQNIDFSHARANIGFEMSIKNNKSLTLGLGYYHSLMHLGKSKGINLSFEYKKFRNENFYLGFGVMGGKLQYEAKSQFFTGDYWSLDSIYSESYTIDKLLIDMYFSFGDRVDLTEHFYFDIFCGIGFRYKETIHLDRTRLEDKMYKHSIRIVDMRDSEGIYFWPILKVGVKLGLKI